MSSGVIPRPSKRTLAAIKILAQKRTFPSRAAPKGSNATSMPAGKLAASDCRPLFARGQRAGPGVSLRWFFFVVLACRQSLVEPKRQAERPERTEEAQWNLVLSITDRGHAGHRLQLLAPVPGCQRTLQGSWDLSRASFYLARFTSSKSNYCKIRKIKLAISTMAVTPTTESTNACVAAW